jgi:hypothetical protein
MIATLDNAWRNHRRAVAGLPDQGHGLAKAVAITNWATEKGINPVCTRASTAPTRNPRLN